MSERKPTQEELEELQRRFPPKNITKDVVGLAKRAMDADSRHTRLVAAVEEAIAHIRAIPAISKDDIADYLQICLDRHRSDS